MTEPESDRERAHRLLDEYLNAETMNLDAPWHALTRAIGDARCGVLATKETS